VMRFGVKRLVAIGLASTGLGYALFLPIGLDSAYATAILPTMILGGLGFALAYGPLNIAATNGVAGAEQGLASGLVNTSFQLGGALVLAVVTAVINATAVAAGTPQEQLDSFRAAAVVSVIAAGLGLLATVIRLRPRQAEDAVSEVVEIEPVETAADAEAA